MTTNEDRVIQQHNDFATCIEIEELSEVDANNLLGKVSERPEENVKHLKRIVNSNYMRRYPLDVVR